MEDQNIDTSVEDDSELDASLEADLNLLRNEKPLAAPAEVKTEVPAAAPAKVEVPAEKKVEPPVPAPVAAEPAAPIETAKVEEKGFRVPAKGPTESDETYQVRVELFKLIDARNKAPTPEAKAALTAKITDTRQEMRNIGAKEDIKNPNNAAPVLQKTEDEIKKEAKITADKAYLREIGAVTKEDLDKERLDIDIGNTLQSFVGRHDEFKDADTREVFFDFVETNYNVAGKTGKALMTVLELAHEAMYKPSETISERVLEGAKVSEKINAMQFPGGTVVKAALTPEQQKSVDELKATGMSEAKALALISDE